MSVENFRQGLSDLVGAVQKNRKAKQEALKEEQLKTAMSEFAKTISNSPEGQTLTGGLVSQGLNLGTIKPKDAVRTMAGLNPERLMLMLQSKIATNPTPELMDAYNRLSTLYDRWNEHKAYFQGRGRLEAKSGAASFDSVAAGSPALGGSSTGRRPAPTRTGGASGMASGGTNVSAGSVPVTVSADSFLDGFDQFIASQPLYKRQLLDKEGNPKGMVGPIKVGPLGITAATNEEIQNHREAVNNHFYQQISLNNPLIGQPGAEKYARQLADQATRLYMEKGLGAFTKITSRKKEGTRANPLILQADVPKELVFGNPAQKETFLNKKAQSEVFDQSNKIFQRVQSVVPIQKNAPNADYYLK